MLKPVTILALDDAAASLADAVQRRAAAQCGLDDLVQWRPVGDVAEAVTAVHARRQAPDSPLRMREDVANRELVLLFASCTTSHLIDVAREVHHLYDVRRFALYFSVEAFCLMPDLFPAPDYGAAYSLLKLLSDTNAFDEVWLLDSTNANRVKFGHYDSDAYAQAIAGVLALEPEMSGAPAPSRPRGMEPRFSSFGYAELFFPRDAALQRLEPRFASELIREKLLAAGPAAHPQLAAKQFVVGDEFAVPLSRIGVDAGQSLFQRFQAKTLVTSKTRSAEEVIAAVRNELKVHREHTHAENLRALHTRGEQTALELAALLSRVVDETLDRHDYASTIALLEALVDPLPDLHAGTDIAPRNLVTEIQIASAALDARLQFAPGIAASGAARRRIRELDDLLHDQKLVADVHAPADAGEQLAALEQEKCELTRRLPELIFAEEAENNAARNAARDAESARLSAETLAKEQQLRELFAQKPRAEQALREALEARRTFLWWQVVIVAAFLAGAWFHRASLAALGVYAIYIAIRYFRDIAPAIRNAREQLERILTLIDTTDKAKNAAHNDELQFEHDVAHRKTTLSVLGRTRDAADRTLKALRVRFAELQQLADSFAPASIASGGLAFSIVDDADVDAWYGRTAEDRKPLLREFPIQRSEARHLAIDDARERIVAYAATGFDSFRKLTLARAVSLAPEGKLAQRLKRFTDAAAPLIELGDDLEAQRAMQRDVTLWMEADPSLTALLQRRLPEAHVQPPRDPLRLQAVSRVLHFPAYVLGQIAHYREQYDPSRYPESASAPDVMPAAILLGTHRQAYEQILLGRAVGVIHLRNDGQLATTNLVLGDSHLVAAQRLTTSQLHDLEREIEPRLTIAGDVERDLRELLEAKPLTELDRTVIDTLLTRYRPDTLQ
jgi:hypothetical protein